MAKVLLFPYDPVHDVALKIIKRLLVERGHDVYLFPPDTPEAEVIEEAKRRKPDFLLISRTVSYEAVEKLARFIDLLDAQGLREKMKVVIGGKAITPELAAELGYDAGFGDGTKWEDVIAFIEEGKVERKESRFVRRKGNLTERYTYEFRDEAMRSLLEEIVSEVMEWASSRSSPGVERAKLRERLLQGEDVLDDYLSLCDDVVVNSYEDGVLPPHVRKLSLKEEEELKALITKLKEENDFEVICEDRSFLVFTQYGTGCPFMDIVHIKACEAWGADGVIHFDPSWGARTEGILSGLLSHEHDGSIITYENLEVIKSSLSDFTLWSVRAHRGLNTPEIALYAGYLGADLTKVNIPYGSLNGGTDPERLTVDGIEALRISARFSTPFDIPTNEELGGVPAYKAFASMLIMAALGLKIGTKPILKPLFCYSPDVMIKGYMDDNYVDYNAAKIIALREIIDAPIWPGEPIGFMTHTEERVQSALTTAFHAALARSLEVDAITIASTDEAYSRGPISVASRIDTLRGVKEALRFLGSCKISYSPNALKWASELRKGIKETLERVARMGFVRSLYEGVLGSREEGANPGRAGRNSVFKE